MLMTNQLKYLPKLLLYNLNKISRKLSSQTEKIGFECLNKRGLLSIKGEGVSDFLQGLITNDMRHFESGQSNIYGLFLNIKGRVLYDTIIYKLPNDSNFLIECDKKIIKSLEKHLNTYKIRRKIEVKSLEEMKIFGLFNLPSITRQIESKDLNEIFPCGGLKNKSSRSVDDRIFIYADPRVNNCLRILSNSDVDEETVKKSLDLPGNCKLSYREFRYQMGIGEGVDELPPGKALPLEINCDYLHGVSFHKGCYIGQELTARTYHTGVIRKRLMPLDFQECLSEQISYDENITDDAGRSVGRFRAVEGRFGLGLMRIAEALNAKNLVLNGKMLTVVKPFWWPVDTNLNEQIKLEKK